MREKFTKKIEIVITSEMILYCLNQEKIMISFKQ